MTKSRELAMLRQLETLAVSPSKHSTRAMIVVLCIVLGGGVFLSVADHVLFAKDLEVLKWSYFGCGMVAGLGVHFLTSAFRVKYVSRYIDVAAVRKRLADLRGDSGADV
jgi:hypothetical protein